MGAGIPLSKGTYIEAGLPNDAKYFNDTVPYANVAEVNSVIPVADRHQGLVVNVAGVEYWYKDGTANNQLIVKESGGGSDNNYSNTEKQKVADGVAHRANSDVHITPLEKFKTNAKKFGKYVENEKLTSITGVDYLRFHNGNAYLYVGAFDEEINTSFTTTNILTELTEDPPRWEAMISTFPPVEFATITPTSIQPLATRNIQVFGSNLTTYTTARFTEFGSTVTSSKITINSYTFVSQNELIINITANSSVLEDFDLYINNGTEVKLGETFSIANGLVVIPEAFGYEFSPRNEANIDYSLGKLSISDASKDGYTGYFNAVISPTSDFTLKFKISDNPPPTTGTSAFVTAFAPNTGTQSYTNNSEYQIYVNTGQMSINVFSTVANSIALNDLLEFRRVGNDMLFYKNGVFISSDDDIDISQNWNVFMYLWKVVFIKDIELTIL